MVILFYPEIRLDPVVLEEKNFFYSLLFLPILKRLLTYFIVFPLELMINYTINSRIKLVNIIPFEVFVLLWRLHSIKVKKYYR